MRRLGTGTVITTKKFVDLHARGSRTPRFSATKLRPGGHLFPAIPLGMGFDGQQTQPKKRIRRQNGVEDPYITRKFLFESVMGLFPLVWKFALEKADVPGRRLLCRPQTLEAIDFGDFAPFTKPTD